MVPIYSGLSVLVEMMKHKTLAEPRDWVYILKGLEQL
jgi:hypothetical protein